MSESDLHEAILALENGWKSKRLVYRAIEDDEEDRKWIRDFSHNDSVTFGQAWPQLFKPQSRASSNDIFEPWLKTRLLAVMICLPGSDSTLYQEATMENKKLTGLKQLKTARYHLHPSYFRSEP